MAGGARSSIFDDIDSEFVPCSEVELKILNFEKTSRISSNRLNFDFFFKQL